METEYLKGSDVYAIHNLFYGSSCGNEEQLKPDCYSVPGTFLRQPTTEEKHSVIRQTSAGYDKTCLDLYLPGNNLRKTLLQNETDDKVESCERGECLLERYLQKTEHHGTSFSACGDTVHERDSCMKSSQRGENLLTPRANHSPHARDTTEDESNVYQDVGGLCSQASEAPLPPLAVFVHGGGWRRGDRKAWRHYVSCDDTNLLVALLLWAAGLYGNVGVDLASRGIACAVISYPLASPSLPVFLLELLFSYLSGLLLVAAVLAASGIALVALPTLVEAAISAAAGLHQQKKGWANLWKTGIDDTLVSDTVDPHDSMHFSLGLPFVLVRTFGFRRGHVEFSSLTNSSVVDAFSSLVEMSSCRDIAMVVLCIYHLVLLIAIGVFRAQYRLHRSHVVAVAAVAVATATLSAILVCVVVVDVGGALQACCVVTLVLVHLPHLYWRLATPRERTTGQVEAVADAVGWLQRWGQQGALYDPTRTVLIGHSAGGHLVSLLGLNTPLLTSSGCPPRHIKAVISVSGVYDLRLLARTGFLRHFYLHPAFGRDVNHWDNTSPLQRARCLATDVYQWTPAFLLVKAASEGVAATSDSDALYRMLHDVGCRVRHLTVPGCNHFNVIVGLGGRRMDKERTLLEVLVEFVREHVTSE